MTDNGCGTAVVTSPDSDVETSNGYKLPPHLLKLHGRWALWRCAGLRGAGFPITDLAKASTPICAREADVVLRCEAETQQARTEAIAALRQLQTETKHQMRAVDKTIKRLWRNLSVALEGEFASVEALAEFCRAQAQLKAALLEYRQAFASDTNRLSERIRTIATAERFREAVIWQNHLAFRTVIETLTCQRVELAKGCKWRRREEVVANYLQRYCSKNDTIGFFGPVGWVSFVDSDEPVNLEIGPNLVASREVYFEGWCIDALAEKLAEEKDMRPWIAPRVRPSVRCEGNIVRLPFGAQVKLIPDHAAVLQACDGTRAARRIAEELIGRSDTTLTDEQSVYSVLDFMYSRKLIFWGLHVPIEAHPEQTLRRLLAQVGDAELRESALVKVDQLMVARDAVSAAGSAEELDRAMGNLEETFTRLTGVEARRGQGNNYAHSLVYEDCRRDLKLEIGKEVLQTLAPPLHLVLKSARWLTARAFEMYRVQFEAIYRRLASANESPQVDIASFWMEIEPVINQTKGEPLDILIREFQQRWSRIFALSDGQRHVHYSTEDISAQVSALFDTSDEIARYVRYHSPDVMIAAESVEAMQRDDYQFILGELHVAVNTLSYLMFVEQHPAPEEFASAWNADIPERRVRPVLAKDYFGGAMRTKSLEATSRDFFLDFANESPDPTPGAVPFAEFVIEEDGGGLTVHSLDGQLHFDGMEFFAMAVVGIVVNCFKIASRQRHFPRVSIDRLVVCRESWSFAASELDFTNEPDETARFLAIRRWAKRHQMPRYVFVSAPGERKPFYVDLDSTIYTDIFAKVVRSTLRRGVDEVVMIAEMLPGPENLWLTDAENNRYTSELRMVALDLAGWNCREEPMPIERGRPVVSP